MRLCTGGTPHLAQRLGRLGGCVSALVFHCTLRVGGAHGGGGISALAVTHQSPLPRVLLDKPDRDSVRCHATHDSRTTASKNGSRPWCKVQRCKSRHGSSCRELHDRDTPRCARPAPLHSCTSMVFSSLTLMFRLLANGWLCCAPLWWQDPASLLPILAGTLNPDNTARRDAERQLREVRFSVRGVPHALLWCFVSFFSTTAAAAAVASGLRAV